ncbi:uncharacterized protein MYCGRDRAFT_83209 [Zymoseptoria tritici IPO323]|uniref:Uncharacterized protein n=1 Tax=Zymoseptoria tritici (strain CBS 115943 / IPO323) TaxID=336722 RepID=F9XRQ4_ZYMTI|nr:uncharacterized protein MYCGRDRAFT_83209 [Zymoseptoria tritici IPO323]EGP82076.1 hypothetical protein MYCGRDRAFT_83209 [Zymoseptoria tritici IPO323]
MLLLLRTGRVFGKRTCRCSNLFNVFSAVVFIFLHGLASSARSIVEDVPIDARIAIPLTASCSGFCARVAIPLTANCNNFCARIAIPLTASCSEFCARIAVTLTSTRCRSPSR